MKAFFVLFRRFCKTAAITRRMAENARLWVFLGVNASFGLNIPLNCLRSSTGGRGGLRNGARGGVGVRRGGELYSYRAWL